MKIYRLVFAAAILATVSVPVALAQTRPAPTQAAPSTATALPNAKVALIYSEAFQDPKAGIVRFGKSREVTILCSMNQRWADFFRGIYGMFRFLIRDRSGI